VPKESIEPDRSGFVYPDTSKKVYWEYYGSSGRDVVCLLNGLEMHTKSWNSVLPSLPVSGILLSHEELFRIYQDMSLRFYRAGEVGSEFYTHYMCEKISGETFVRGASAHLENMRLAFFKRYERQVHSLKRLTEAQIPFFEQLENNMPAYRAIRTPTLILAGDQDRVILPSVQRKIADGLPISRFELIENSGCVVYLEQREAFSALLKRFYLKKASCLNRQKSAGINR
jgi:pimeloyl-ACP methyl ester carboxylesterase